MTLFEDAAPAPETSGADLSAASVEKLRSLLAESEANIAEIKRMLG